MADDESASPRITPEKSSELPGGCSACGKPIDEADDFCRHCGHPRRSRGADRDRQHRFFALIALIALLALFALLAALLIGHDDDSSSATSSGQPSLLQCSSSKSHQKTSGCTLKVNGHSVTGNFVLAGAGALVTPCSNLGISSASVCSVQLQNNSKTTKTTNTIAITVVQLFTPGTSNNAPPTTPTTPPPSTPAQPNLPG
jgi:hypothetical protein